MENLPQILSEDGVLSETLDANIITSDDLDVVLSAIEKIADEYVVDLSTKETRKAAVSQAYKITRSKTALDDMGKKLCEKSRKFTDMVNSRRRDLRDRLDAAADKIRTPVREWEDVEKERVAKIRGAIHEMEVSPEAIHWPSSDIDRRIVEVTDIYNKSDFAEFSDDADVQYEKSIALLTSCANAARQREIAAAEQIAKDAELAKLRIDQEKAEHEKQEMENRLQEAERRKNTQLQYEDAEISRMNDVDRLALSLDQKIDYIRNIHQNSNFEYKSDEARRVYESILVDLQKRRSDEKNAEEHAQRNNEQIAIALLESASGMTVDDFQSIDELQKYESMVSDKYNTTEWIYAGSEALDAYSRSSAHIESLMEEILKKSEDEKRKIILQKKNETFLSIMNAGFVEDQEDCADLVDAIYNDEIPHVTTK